MKDIKRKKNLISIREKLNKYIKQKKNFNFRDLSRQLKKNDAYLQQYITRGSPTFLPEEERLKLSSILNINVNYITPYWLQSDVYEKKNFLEIKNLKNENKNLLPSILLKDYNTSNTSLIGYDQLKILKSNKVYLVNFIFDRNVSSYLDESYYLLKDKEKYFFAYLSLKKNNDQGVFNLIVKPYYNNFRPFRTDEKNLNIYSKILYISCLLNV